MSWMDSWSRPSKSQATPAPYYLLPGGEATPYCHACGRVIGARKTTTAASTGQQARYCSARCRGQKPGKLDRRIEGVFVRLLEGLAPFPEEQGTGQAAVQGEGTGQGKEGKEKKGEPGADDEHRTKGHVKGKRSKDVKGAGKRQKGDTRLLISCAAVEDLMFPDHELDDGTASVHSHASSGGPDEQEPPKDTNVPSCAEDDIAHLTGTDADFNTPYVDGDVLARMAVRSGTRIRPPQAVSEVNGSVGGEKGRAERIEETEAMLAKRIGGQRRAREREMVRSAARRLVVFGTAEGGKGDGKDNGEGRKCEAVMQGKVVEPSFAKGDWSIRWRE